eukprot:TRINITY_DN56056_c0_g1_i1.p1 TRINITY_DN56056_c0_g1~~TRINITY_DN56056_c0_g1_i1.p1  ORF type:complete len:280 (+),score=58.43 TRINITY_DN56056_c0_g1_i1:127-966(+)
MDEETFWALIAHAVLFWLLYRVFRWCGKRFGGPAVDEAPVSATREQLQPRKSVCVAYFVFFFTGLFGGHHYYLERIAHGTAATWSLNFFGFGLLLDLFLIPSYVRGYNKKRTIPSAPSDGNRKQLLLVLPCVVLILASVFGILVVYGPSLLDRFGIVDIERLAADTLVNPYETLGVARGASLAQAKSAYRQLSLKWHPDRNLGCGKECERKMAELGKAFDRIKKKDVVPTDNTWLSKVRATAKEWWYVVVALNNEEAENKQKSEGTSTKQKRRGKKPKT